MTAFRADMDRYLDAIQRRDLDALADTVDPDDVVLITAGGDLIIGRERFLEMHRKWFERPTWRLDTDLVHVRETAELATAILRLDYRDESADGPVHEESLLALAFRRHGDRWLMVHDQNTPIRSD